MPPSGDWEAEGSGVKVLATINTVELSQKKGINLTKRVTESFLDKVKSNFMVQRH